MKEELDSASESALPDLSFSDIDFDDHDPAFAEYKSILDRFDVRVLVSLPTYITLQVRKSMELMFSPAL